MGQARSFSIFLLKSGYTSPAKALKVDHGLVEASHKDGIGTAWPTYLASKVSTAPWWRDYFGISDTLSQGFAGAIVFVGASNRTFALTFGHMRHHLRDESYEHDFGLRATLNSVNPDKIRNTDELDPTTSRRRRTQLPERTDINYFDFDEDSSVLRSLTGAIRPEYKALFSHATGASNLRVSTKERREGLPQLLQSIYEVYEKDTYLTAFPAATSIQPVKDPAILQLLDGKLKEAVQAGSHDLALTIPELMDFQEDFEVSYSGAGKSELYPDADITDYFAYLTARGKPIASLTVADLQHHRLCVTTDDGGKKGDFSVYRSLVFETTLTEREEVYHISEGVWYRVDADYLKKLASNIDPLFTDLGLPARTEHLEADYNERQLVAHWPGSVLLDKSNTSPRGEKQVEPCDVARAEGGLLVLTHVKFGVAASDLSHLFTQGANSIDLLNGVEEARAILKDLIRQRDPNFDFSGLTNLAFRVEYVIVTKNDTNRASGALPLFSRISLRRASRALRSMKTEVVVTLVEDAYVGTPRPKPRKKPAKKSSTK